MSTYLTSGFATKSSDIQFITSALLNICCPELEPVEKPHPKEVRLSYAEQAEHIYQTLRRAKPHEELLAKEVREIYERAKLTPKQAKVLAMRLAGLSFDEIGLRRGATKQAVQVTFLTALKKLARSLHVYPYTGLADVYRSETCRGLG